VAARRDESEWSREMRMDLLCCLLRDGEHDLQDLITSAMRLRHGYVTASSLPRDHIVRVSRQTGAIHTHTTPQHHKNCLGIIIIIIICLSVCSSVWLSVAWNAYTKTRFSQKLSNLELWSLLTTNRKSYTSFLKNPFLGPYDDLEWQQTLNRDPQQISPRAPQQTLPCDPQKKNSRVSHNKSHPVPQNKPREELQPQRNLKSSIQAPIRLHDCMVVVVPRRGRRLRQAGQSWVAVVMTCEDETHRTSFLCQLVSVSDEDSVASSKPSSHAHLSGMLLHGQLTVQEKAKIADDTGRFGLGRTDLDWTIQVVVASPWFWTGARLACSRNQAETTGIST